MKIMDNCKYITTGTFTGAAISEEDELYTWGCNIFGECGIEVTDDDSMLAVGENLGTQEKVTEVNGDLVETQTHYYSDSFVPIRVK